MANRYVRSTGGNWNTNGTWESTPGGGESVAKPTAADDVFLVVGSGQLTMDGTGSCRSINLTGYNNTFTHTSNTLTVGTTTAPPSNIALKFSGMGVSGVYSGGGGINLSSTEGTQVHTIDYGTVALVGAQTFNQAASYRLESNVTSGLITVSAGTLDLNGYTFNGGSFQITGSTAKTIYFRNSTINITSSGGTGLGGSSSNTTIPANTATINCSSATTLNFNGMDWNGITINITGASGTVTLTGNATNIKDFTVSSGRSITLTTGATILCTGAITYNSLAWKPISSSADADPVPTTPTFSGITQLEAVGGGCLRATWSAGSNLTGYNIYVRAGSSTDLFTATYFKGTVDASSTECIFRTLADNTTFLQDSTGAIYVGVRAYNDNGNCTVAGTGVTDSNTTSLFITPVGSGETYAKFTTEAFVV